MSLSHRNSVIRDALEKIRLQDPEEMLRPEAIVRAATSKRHVLHKEFTWDDTRAAHERRLDQACKLIRITVMVIAEERAPVRAYVSLTTDRPKGYRAIPQVLSKEELRAQMLEDALNDLLALKRKYRALVELEPIWLAMNAVKDPSTSKAKSRKTRDSARPRH